MSERHSSAASQCTKNQALEKVEALCCKVLADTTQPLTLSLPDLLALEDAIPKIGHRSVWAAVSERSLPGLLNIYFTSIRRSSPLLEPCSAAEAQHQEVVRAVLSKEFRSGASDLRRELRLVMAIVRAQSLRCYAVLLAGAVASLERQPSKRVVDAAHSLVTHVVALVVFMARSVQRAEVDREARSALLRALTTELTASSLLEHWARLLLTLASCEDSERALEVAAAHLPSFSIAHTLLTSLNSGCAHRLLVSSPCLSYLLISQLVALCAALGGGTVYGMPEVPGGVLFTAALALPTESHLSRMEQAVRFGRDTLAQLPWVLQLQLQQAPDLATGLAPAVGAHAPALSIASAATNAPATEFMAGTAGLYAAAVSDEGQEAGQGRQGTGPTAADTAGKVGARIGARRPLLLDPTVCMEVSARLTIALGRAFEKDTGSAQQAQGGGSSASSRLTQFQQQLAKSVSLTIVLEAVSNALAVALPATAGLLMTLEGSGDRGGSGFAPGSCAHKAPSPVKLWWEGAVAMGNILTVAAAHFSEEREQTGMLLEQYFGLLELITVWEQSGLPAQPSATMAAALSAGFLPGLERLLRAALPLPTHYQWTQQWGGGWEAVWAQMLLFADADQVAGVVDAVVEGLRRAVAGASTAGERDYGAWDTLERAALAATRLAGCKALAWLPGLAAGPRSDPEEPGTSACVGGSPGSAPSCAPVVKDVLQARLGESLSLIATRLLPELSRALLGAVLPAYHRGGIYHLDTMCLVLRRQLSWVPTLAAAIAAESVPAAAAAAAVGGGSDGGGGGSNDGGSGIAGPCKLDWRQLLFVELRLPRLLGAALGVLLWDVEVRDSVRRMREGVYKAMWALAALVPTDLARMVAAADRAEAAAAARLAAAGRDPATTPRPRLPPPSSGLLRSALGPGEPLENAELLAAVEAACVRAAGGAWVGSVSGGESKGGLLPDAEELLRGARLLSLQG